MTAPSPRLSLRMQKAKVIGKGSLLFIFAAAFFTTLIGLWAGIMVSSSSPPLQRDSHMAVSKLRHHVREGSLPSSSLISSSHHEDNRMMRSLQQNKQPDSNSRKPRVIGIHAYSLNSPDWDMKREERNRDIPPYFLVTEKIDPYLLSHTPLTLRRIRFHYYYPEDTTLTDVVKNYRLAINGAPQNSYIKSEDPLRHLMLLSKSRDTLKNIRDESEDYEEAMATPLEDEECEATPKNAKWMLRSFPTCNFLHENNLADGVRKSITKIVGHGYWRDVWPVLDAGSSIRLRQKKVALKTMRYEHDYTERNFHRHIRDATVSERLTSSPLVTSIYAFCGNSGYFEFATGGSLASRLEESFVAKYTAENKYAMGRTTKNDDDIAVLDQYTKLSLAHQVAAGLADFHDADAMRDKDGEIISASIVHADITTDQFININGVYKLNDFNRCRFMRRYRDNTEFGGDGKPCGFFVANNPAKFRSPEEYAYTVETEKVDIYSMGNIFYSILTNMDPWEGVDEKKAQKAVLAGKRPDMPSSIMLSTDSVDIALREVMYMCWEHKPEDRPRARTVADYLSKKLRKFDKEMGKVTRTMQNHTERGSDYRIASWA